MVKIFLVQNQLGWGDWINRNLGLNSHCNMADRKIINLSILSPTESMWHSISDMSTIDILDACPAQNLNMAFVCSRLDSFVTFYGRSASLITLPGEHLETMTRCGLRIQCQSQEEISATMLGGARCAVPLGPGGGTYLATQACPLVSKVIWNGQNAWYAC